MTIAWYARGVLAALLVLAGVPTAVAQGTLTFGDDDGPVRAQVSDSETDASEPANRAIPALPANAMLQPQPLLAPRLERQAAGAPSTSPGAAALSTARQQALARRLGSPPELTLSVPIGINLVSGAEAKVRASTDAGDLLDKSPSILGVRSQRRNPVITDPRVRGSRVGQLAASGSYWVPARIDLDTAMSKIDSSLVEGVSVVKGPYTSLYGPGLGFVHFELLDSPRFFEGFASGGSSSIEYKTNGNQWHGRQSLYGGGHDWGMRFGYSDRHGADYRSGAGTIVPASYHSREFDLALGYDPSPDSQLEFNVLRLDQTDVELPGQAFDIDFLNTNGLELRYTLEDQPYYDLLTIESWYNRTALAGNAQGPGKRRQFPFYDFIGFTGNTDVDSMSLGYSVAASWGDRDTAQLTAGVDLRYIKQELNEITSGRIGFVIWDNANSPIPRSDWLNSGFFAQLQTRPGDRLTVQYGARADVVRTEVIDDPAKLENLGTRVPQSSLAEIIGSDQFDQSFMLWLVYMNAQYELSDSWSLNLAAGHSQRPPSLTELYAAEPFMFLLQNGLNTVTGDPRLEEEKLYQIDLGLNYNRERLRGGLAGFHAWVNDRITFENLGVVQGPPLGQVEQVNLKYVNTDLATLAGAEAFVEYDLSDYLTPFATLAYVYGRDRSRDGNFATSQAQPGSPSTRDASLERGAFSGFTGPNDEPLPGIAPLESRLGLRLHEPSPRPRWQVELLARMVDGQDQVASSLFEAPTSGFTVWDVRGYWQHSDSLMLIAGVENFTDRAYREHFDFRSPSGIQVLQPGANFYFSGELVY